MEAWRPDALPELMAKHSISLREAMAMGRGARLVVARRKVHNLVVTTALPLLGDVLVGADSPCFAYLAWGTGSTTPVVGDTQLTAEAGRVAPAQTVRSSLTLIIDAYAPRSTCSVNIQECGIFGGATATATANTGRMFCHYLLAYDNTAGLNDLSFDYELTIG